MNILPMRLPFLSTNTHHSALPLFATTATVCSVASAFPRRCRRKDKVVVIMGATGTGKSKLSVDLATLFFPFSEIVNSDKIQVYKGLDITTNKIPIEERRGVPHHLLGEFDPVNGEFTSSEFRRRAGGVVDGIVSRGNLPIVVGGSNSFIHALLVERFNPESNVFDGESCPAIRAELTQLRYDCCFLWVDVSFPVLSDYFSKRVDDMLNSGMVDELAEFCAADSVDSECDSASQSGIKKAIGVPEFNRYFKEYPPTSGLRNCWGSEGGDPLRKGAYEAAVKAIKDNTCHLAKIQMGKILRLKDAGWDLQRLDATAAITAAMGRRGRWSEIWEREVLEPSVKIVRRFLKE